MCTSMLAASFRQANQPDARVFLILLKKNIAARARGDYDTNFPHVLPNGSEGNEETATTVYLHPAVENWSHGHSAQCAARSCESNPLDLLINAKKDTKLQIKANQTKSKLCRCLHLRLALDRKDPAATILSILDLHSE